MLVSVSARHGNLGTGDQSLIEDKVEKLRRLYDRVNAIEVIVDLEKLDSPALEAKVSVEHEEDFIASATATTVIGALDVVIPKLEKQLRRAKEKRTEHRATGLKHLEMEQTDVADEV